MFQHLEAEFSDELKFLLSRCNFMAQQQPLISHREILSLHVSKCPRLMKRLGESNQHQMISKLELLADGQTGMDEFYHWYQQNVIW